MLLPLETEVSVALMRVSFFEGHPAAPPEMTPDNASEVPEALQGESNQFVQALQPAPGLHHRQDPAVDFQYPIAPLWSIFFPIYRSVPEAASLESHFVFQIERSALRSCRYQGLLRSGAQHSALHPKRCCLQTGAKVQGRSLLQRRKSAKTKA